MRFVSIFSRFRSYYRRLDERRAGFTRCRNLHLWLSIFKEDSVVTDVKSWGRLIIDFHMSQSSDSRLRLIRIVFYLSQFKSQGGARWIRITPYMSTFSALKAFWRNHLLSQIIFKRRHIPTSNGRAIFLTVDQLLEIRVLARTRFPLFHEQRWLIRLIWRLDSAFRIVIWFRVGRQRPRSWSRTVWVYVVRRVRLL